MKILYATDLHGDLEKYNELFKVAVESKADIVINGGDMLPKEGNLLDQKDFITSHLLEHFEKFEKKQIYYLFYPGNDDLKIFDPLIAKICKKCKFIKNIAQKMIPIAGYEFIGMNLVSDYPFRLKDRCRKDTKASPIRLQYGTALLSDKNGFREIPNWDEYVSKLPTIEEELRALKKPKDASKSVYVIHMPPDKLGLDVCFHGEKVGSKAVYDFIKLNQPKLTLHGHIHESPQVTGVWKTKLDKTLCVQPGQMNGFTYVLIDLDKDTCERFTV